MPVFKQQNKSISIPFDFIDNYFPSANPAFIIVYIYALRLAAEERMMSYNELASKLGLLESDIVRALNFWADKKLISYDENFIIFNNNISEINENPYKINKNHDNIIKPDFPKKNTEVDDSDYNNAENYSSDKSVEYNKKHTQPASPEKPSNTEIRDMTRQKKELAVMLEKVQEIFGSKMLTNAEIKTLFSLNKIGLSPEVIALLVQYCVSKDKKDMNYIEKTAMNWNDNGINTPEKVLALMSKEKSKNALMTELKKMFQIYGRNFTEPEENMIMTWINDYHISTDLIEFAYQTTIMNINTFNIKYMNGIITKWYEKGITDRKAAIADQQQYNAAKSNTGYSDRNSYKDYEVFKNDNYDYNDIEQRSWNINKNN